MKGNIGAIVVILVGVLVLAINLGVVEIDFAQIVRTWWPVLLIALGIGMFLAPGSGDRR
ncbi:LiaI-LiaF-like domain-containing protein [Accumulibacter sp.]|uniref:LiaI-LiaF-like domain-containing protein n=1 Tax=Accumulibacter sp. TaxID=2053492 RepID=UPI0025DCE5E5|nr:DUF5668 domain-containing protein [Accumulibacter sp.]MCM8596037.1 DUF5668 domain-containing protein [Accumulibacter sp.]MCM8627062.1 DUF5668 domain-containing protein [Accumulibacter sp.]MDS4050186.1 DUF5668 domain-containing protein [Accumulibacter sp.]